MKGVLSSLEPKKVFHYFEALSDIPHGSGNTKAVSDYCAAFAEERNLEYYQDEYDNVIIMKEATKGYENAPAVILQGHLDMVCEKTPESAHDFQKDPLDLRVEGDFVYAKDTTLGGDDGIAVAYALAILDSDDIPHPRLECIFTSDEEIGLLGAAQLDVSSLKASYMLNLDSEEEGIFLTSCAGGIRYNLHLPVSFVEETRCVYTITLGGLSGGHSGVEIHKGKGNSNKLMGRLLYELSLDVCYGLQSLSGGQRDNVIPSESMAVVLVDESDKALFEETLGKMEAVLMAEYSTQDPGLFIHISGGGVSTERMMKPRDKELVLFLLMNAPCGVQSYSPDIEGLVESSLNLGVMNTAEEEILFGFSIRSSVKSRKEALGHQLEYLVSFLGGSYTTSGDYPGWEYRKESALRELMCGAYEVLFGKQPLVQAIHAGLECGIISEKMPDLDIISFGPDLLDIHSVKERMSVSSVERTYRLMLEALKRMV